MKCGVLRNSDGKLDMYCENFSMPSLHISTHSENSDLKGENFLHVCFRKYFMVMI